MRKLVIPSAILVAGLALAQPSAAMTTQPLAAAAKHVAVQPLQAQGRVECMTDDGFGRRRPCSYGYKQANPNWRSGNECYTDDGNGRYRPCSYGYKQRQQRKAGQR